MARLGDNRYGKSRVRLSRITRLKDRHEFNEWTVHVMLKGDFEASFTKADNSKVLPTDTMKNTVYSVARGSQAKTIESFAMELGDYFLANNAQVSGVSIEIEERAWERIAVGGCSRTRHIQAQRNGASDCTRDARTRRRMGCDLRRRRANYPQDHKIGLHRLRCRQADHAQAGHRSHSRYVRNHHVGLCGCNP